MPTEAPTEAPTTAPTRTYEDDVWHLYCCTPGHALCGYKIDPTDADDRGSAPPPRGDADCSICHHERETNWPQTHHWACPKYTREGD